MQFNKGSGDFLFLSPAFCRMFGILTVLWHVFQTLSKISSAILRASSVEILFSGVCPR